MSRAVIVCAAEIKNYQRIRENLKQDDFYIFCDGGLYHKEPLGVKADLIVGDFDSYIEESVQEIKERYTDSEIIALPREKDDTDSMYAARLAEKKGFKDVLILGATGNRLDHTLCNLGVLIKFFTNQIKAAILDDYSEICIAGSSPVTIDSKFKYFSVLAVTPVCRGVYIRDAKYPLEDGVIKIENQYGISNEVLPGKSSSKVWVNDGLVMVIKDF